MNAYIENPEEFTDKLLELMLAISCIQDQYKIMEIYLYPINEQS